jgi:hypothetical protein
MTSRRFIAAAALALAAAASAAAPPFNATAVNHFCVVTS